MKRKRFSEEKIIGVLKEFEAGAKTKDLVVGMAYRSRRSTTCKARYAGMTVRTQ
jgi:putative transposase